MGEKVEWESWVERRTSQIKLGTITSIANEKLSRGIRNKSTTKMNFLFLLKFTFVTDYSAPPHQLCRRMGSGFCGQSITFNLAASYSLQYSSALTWVLFYSCAVLLKQIAPAARKPAPVCALKHRLQLLKGACSGVEFPWALVSIKASLPAPEWGFSTGYRKTKNGSESITSSTVLISLLQSLAIIGAVKLYHPIEVDHLSANAAQVSSRKYDSTSSRPLVNSN
ncbi:PREDICTED: uncharacterized protein LOC106857797 [Sturnus vulgaris]|uniref:uncharacterized protein LOC106857797 n=1 Tax=Sturnus vulgaris TaxID=9172 RepID=UPI00071A8265|nr:PREDICTED: uncharacterized protein LOC106857797 [Sturnus vulgaris]